MAYVGKHSINLRFGKIVESLKNHSGYTLVCKKTQEQVLIALLGDNSELQTRIAEANIKANQVVLTRKIIQMFGAEGAGT